MKKIVDKSIIQEAINAALNKEVLTEAPFSSQLFDAPSRALGAVKNLGAGVAGQMRLGSVNKQIERTAERITDDWSKTANSLKKTVEKMSQSTNPEIKQKGQKVAQNLDGINKNVVQATSKMKQMVQGGMDQSTDNKVEKDDDDLSFKDKTDEFGISYKESPVDRWIRSWGSDPERDFSKPEKGSLTKVFLNLQAAGVNPFKVEKKQAEKLLAYQSYRVKQIEKVGEDPFPNEEHVEHVLKGTPIKQLLNKNKERSSKEEPQTSKDDDAINLDDKDVKDLTNKPSKRLQKAVEFFSSHGKELGLNEMNKVEKLEALKSFLQKSGTLKQDNDRDKKYLETLDKAINSLKSAEHMPKKLGPPPVPSKPTQDAPQLAQTPDMTADLPPELEEPVRMPNVADTLGLSSGDEDPVPLTKLKPDVSNEPHEPFSLTKLKPYNKSPEVQDAAQNTASQKPKVKRTRKKKAQNLQ